MYRQRCCVSLCSRDSSSFRGKKTSEATASDILLHSSFSFFFFSFFFHDVDVRPTNTSGFNPLWLFFRRAETRIHQVIHSLRASEIPSQSVSFFFWKFFSSWCTFRDFHYRSISSNAVTRTDDQWLGTIVRSITIRFLHTSTFKNIFYES